MGNRLIAEVMDHAPATLTHREAWVLGVLAADANDDSRETWNSIESSRILGRARVSRPQMYEVLKALINKKVLARVGAGQKNAAAKYAIPPLAPAQCPENPDTDGPSQCPETPDADTSQCQQNPDTDHESQCHVFPDTEPAQCPETPDADTSQCPGIPDPYFSKAEERDLSPHRAAATPERPDPFDRFWAEYPRKVAKATAKKAFTAAVKAGADPAHIIAAVPGHVAHWRALGRAPEFIPYAATWLRAESYDDQLHTPQPAGPQPPQHQRYADRGVF